MKDNIKAESKHLSVVKRRWFKTMSVLAIAFFVLSLVDWRFAYAQEQAQPVEEPQEDKQTKEYGKDKVHETAHLPEQFQADITGPNSPLDEVDDEAPESDYLEERTEYAVEVIEEEDGDLIFVFKDWKTGEIKEEIKTNAFSNPMSYKQYESNDEGTFEVTWRYDDDGEWDGYIQYETKNEKGGIVQNVVKNQGGEVTLFEKTEKKDWYSQISKWENNTGKTTTEVYEPGGDSNKKYKEKGTKYNGTKYGKDKKGEKESKYDGTYKKGKDFTKGYSKSEIVQKLKKYIEKRIRTKWNKASKKISKTNFVEEKDQAKEPSSTLGPSKTPATSKRAKKTSAKASKHAEKDSAKAAKYTEKDSAKASKHEAKHAEKVSDKAAKHAEKDSAKASKHEAKHAEKASVEAAKSAEKASDKVEERAKKDSDKATKSAEKDSDKATKSAEKDSEPEENKAEKSFVETKIEQVMAEEKTADKESFEQQQFVALQPAKVEVILPAPETIAEEFEEVLANFVEATDGLSEDVEETLLEFVTESIINAVTKSAEKAPEKAEKDAEEVVAEKVEKSAEEASEAVADEAEDISVTEVTEELSKFVDTLQSLKEEGLSSEEVALEFLKTVTEESETIGEAAFEGLLDLGEVSPEEIQAKIAEFLDKIDQSIANGDKDFEHLKETVEERLKPLLEKAIEMKLAALNETLGEDKLDSEALQKVADEIKEEVSLGALVDSNEFNREVSDLFIEAASQEKTDFDREKAKAKLGRFSTKVNAIIASDTIADEITWAMIEIFRERKELGRDLRILLNLITRKADRKVIMVDDSHDASDVVSLLEISGVNDVEILGRDSVRTEIEEAKPSLQPQGSSGAPPVAYDMFVRNTVDFHDSFLNSMVMQNIIGQPAIAIIGGERYVVSGFIPAAFSSQADGLDVIRDQLPGDLGKLAA